MADEPADWEAIHQGTPPSRMIISAAETVYADDRYFPGCLVLRGGGRIIAIVPRDNLLMLRRVTAEVPEAAVPGPAVTASGSPSPMSLAALQGRGETRRTS